MADLDHFDRAGADPGAMLDRIRDLPQQLRDSWAAATALSLPESYRSASQILILGMGGSAIGGDLLRVYAAQECSVPILVSREYDLPAWVGPSTLVIGVSFSGGTEETLTTFEQAAARGAKLLVATTGGRLAELARVHNAPVLTVHYASQPRAALGHLFTPLIAILSSLGFIADKTAEYDEAVALLDTLRERFAAEQPAAQNQAKQLAQALYGKIPVIYGAGLLAEVAHRWKTQVNENSKNFSFYELYPELNHNAVVGYEHPTSALENVAIVELDSPHIHPRVRVRMGVTDTIMSRAGVSYHRILAEGQSPLAQIYALITLGDYVTYYLAILNDADPTPVETISYLKDELAKVAQ